MPSVPSTSSRQDRPSVALLQLGGFRLWSVEKSSVGYRHTDVDVSPRPSPLNANGFPGPAVTRRLSERARASGKPSGTETYHTTAPQKYSNTRPQTNTSANTSTKIATAATTAKKPFGIRLRCRRTRVLCTRRVFVYLFTPEITSTLHLAPCQNSSTGTAPQARCYTPEYSLVAIVALN